MIKTQMGLVGVLLIALTNGGTSFANAPSQQVDPVAPADPVPGTILNGPRVEDLGNNRYRATFGGVPANTTTVSADTTQNWPQLHRSGDGTAFVSANSALQVQLPARRTAMPFRLSVSGYVYPWPEQIRKADARTSNASEAAQAATQNETASCGIASTADVCPAHAKVEPPLAKLSATALQPPSPSPVRPVFIAGTLTWRPLGLFVISGTGVEQALSGSAVQSAGRTDVDSGVVQYSGVAAGIDESFRQMPHALERVLHIKSREAFVNVANQTHDASMQFEDRAALSLPSGFTLFANDQTQLDAFETTGLIEVRDAKGAMVWAFAPIVVTDAGDPLGAVRGVYRVQPVGNEIVVSRRVPMHWMLAQERLFPVSINDSVFIYPSVADNMIFPQVPTTNYGNNQDLWVTDLARSLVKWNLAVLPAKAMIDSSETKLAYYTASGVADMTVYAHQVSTNWDELQSTWNNRFTSTAWGNAGGDYDPIVLGSAFLTGNPPASVSYPSWNVHPTVAEWHSGYRGNYGVLYRGVATASGSSIKQFYARERGSSFFLPELDVVYTVGPVPVVHTAAPVSRNVPSPDWYSFDSGAGASNDMWQGFGLRPQNGQDYDMRLMLTADAGLGEEVAASTFGGDYTDYILVDRNHAPAASYFPVVTQFARRGSYLVEHARRGQNNAITPPVISSTVTANTADVLDVWDVNLTAGRSYSISVKPTSGNANISIALHQSNPTSATTWYQGANNALVYKESVSVDDRETLDVNATDTDRYGLVVMTKASSGPTGYTVYADDTPPEGQFAINNGAGYTNNRIVTLNNPVADGGTGMYDMRFHEGPLPTVLLFQDEPSWGSAGIQDILALAEISSVLLPSSEITATDFSPFSAIILPSVQSNAFCAAVNANTTKFAAFVQNGGTLVAQLASYVGNVCFLSLPDGVSVDASYNPTNTLVLPTHPIALGLPDVLVGNSASHGAITGLPGGSTVIARLPTGEPTVAEYAHGSGKVIATTTTGEYGWLYDEDSGKVLQNTLNYLANQTPYAAQRTWVLPAGDGAKTVYGDFRNNAGMWSLQSDTIVLDTVAPASQASLPDVTYGGPIRVNWTAADATSPTSVVLWVKFENGAWGLAGLPAQAGTSGVFSYVPTNGLGNYAFATVATDAAGNAEAAPSGAGDDITLLKNPNVYMSMVLRDYCPFIQETENNSTGDVADPLCIGTVITGLADDSSDYFYFDVVTPRTVNITLDNHPGASQSGFPVQLQLRYGPNGISLFGDFDFRPPYAYSRFLGPGRYYVRIFYANAPNTSQTYRLLVTFG
jgi:hypothetical protein